MARASTRSSTLTPASVFLVLSSLIGLGYLIATPPLRAPDEFRHLRRVVQITGGGVIDGAMGPVSLERLARALRGAPGRARPHDRVFPVAKLTAAANIPLDAQDTVHLPGDRYLPYSPLVYLPAVITVWIATQLEARPLVLLYLARLSLLAGGIGLLVVSMRVSPMLSWTLCFLALLPTASFVRSGVTADTLTMGCAFLLFATILSLRERSGPIGLGGLVALVAVGIALGLCKTGYLPLTWTALALPAERFASSRQRWLSVLAAIGVPLLVSAAWLLVLGDWVANDSHRRADADEQLRRVLEDPSRFLFVLESTWLSPARLWRLAGTFVGRILALGVPTFFVPLSLAVVAVLAFVDQRGASPSLLERVLFATSALACLVVISLGLYLKSTSVGSATIRGFQGRYFYPLVPFLLVALLPPRRLHWSCPATVLAILVALVAVAANAWGISAVIGATWLGGA